MVCGERETIQTVPNVLRTLISPSTHPPLASHPRLLTYLDEQLQVGVDEAVASQGSHGHSQSLRQGGGGLGIGQCQTFG